MGLDQRADPRDDRWNGLHRSEAPLQRADRNFAEILQELRVAQTGGQILFGFLLTLSFTARFEEIDAFSRTVYLCTLFASAVTTLLLVAPAAAHRLMFQRGHKRELVRLSHRFVAAGLACLAVTMSCAMLLVVDIVAGRGPAVAGAAALIVAVAALWLLVPLGAARAGRASRCDPPVSCAARRSRSAGARARRGWARTPRRARAGR